MDKHAKQNLREICKLAKSRPDAITIFNLDTGSDEISAELVECALKRSTSGGIFHKVDIAICGNRCDILRNLIEQYQEEDTKQRYISVRKLLDYAMSKALLHHGYSQSDSDRFDAQRRERALIVDYLVRIARGESVMK